MLVVGGDRGVVVAGDPDDAPVAQQAHDFIGPRRVARKIAKVVDRLDVGASIDLGEHCPQRRQIGVDVGDQREALH